MGKATDEQVIQALLACGGVVTHAANKLGMTRTALSTRISTNQDFIDAREEGRQNVLDAAESSLFKAARNGDPWAVRFVLGRLGRDRGYGAKVENLGVATGRVVVYLPQDRREQRDSTTPRIEDRTAARSTSSGAGE